MSGGTTSLDQLPGVLVGHATDAAALTGCTAMVFPGGAVGGHAALGVASGSRELAAFSPRHVVERVHGVCLAGGSAFGLAAAGGVMRRLEQAGIGHDTSTGLVPIVAGAVVYDLNLGDGSVRPDDAMGFTAASQALDGAPARSGNVGAGAGVCAGKLLGVRCATKTGLGNGGAAGDEGVLVGALAVVNPVGDVLDPSSGRILAGARKTPQSSQLVGTASMIRAGSRCDPLHHNTTLAVVATNALLSRAEACWVAEQAGVAIARLVDPPFTRHDGDLVFCASVGQLQVDVHRVGLLARDALAEAIVDACRSAEPAGALPSCEGLAAPGP
jgi:L-aminopeptidase/D-esterase-like protein